MSKFEPKGEDVIRQEVIEDLKGDSEDFNEEEYRATIDRITQRRLKDESFKASEKKKNTTIKELLNEIEGETDYDKLKVLKDKLAKARGEKGKTELKGLDNDVEKLGISQIDINRFFGAGHSRTELGFIIKVMKAEGNDFNEAWKSDLFKAYKDKNDAKIKSKKSKLGPSGYSVNPGDNKPQPKTEQEKRMVGSLDKMIERNKKVYNSEKPKK